MSAAGGRLEGRIGGDISAISMDSRTIEPGEAFFAISGDRFDGHRFVGAALSRGASLAVVSEAFDGTAPEGKVAGGQAAGGEVAGPLVRVDDPLAAMRRLAAVARERSQARIIGVTGSVGKTGTKRALDLALSPSGVTHASPASYNNHWGVPFTLANLPQSARFGVFEMGMNHAGEIAALSRLVRPHIAVITTVEPVHIGQLGSIEAIADAKAEIFVGLEPDGIAVLNRDNGQFERVNAEARARGVRVVRFGAHREADARLIDLTETAAGSRVEADILGERIAYKISAPGRHLVMNSLAVLATVRLAGGDLVQGARALGEWGPAKGRGEQTVISLDGGEAVLIDESYNANPASVRAALGVLATVKPHGRGRRIAVLGDMLELGERTAHEHRALAGPIAEAEVDTVFVCGNAMRALFDCLPAERRGSHAETSGALVGPLLDALGAGDVVMVKGSFAIGMGAVVEALKGRGSASGGVGG